MTHFWPQARQNTTTVSTPRMAYTNSSWATANRYSVLEHLGERMLLVWLRGRKARGGSDYCERERGGRVVMGVTQRSYSSFRQHAVALK